MRICIPTETTEGAESIVYSHFGSAPFFAIYDTEKSACYSVPNCNDPHDPSKYTPLVAFAGEKVDVVICKGMGARAVQVLNERNMRAYSAEGKTVAEMVANFQKGLCQELDSNNSCQDHSCH